MSKCVIAGVFDPFTKGHLNIIERAAVLGEVFVAVADNAKKASVLNAQQRCTLIQKAGVRAEVCRGLLVDFCKERDIKFTVKGVRNLTDFDYESDMFKANLELGGIDTILLPACPEFSFVSSSFVKELIALEKDVSAYVPEEILPDVLKAYKQQSASFR